MRNSVVRAAYSAFMAAAKSGDHSGNGAGFAAKAFPGDRATQEILLRGAVAPVSSADVALVGDQVSAFLGSLAPMSATARLMALGLPISLDAQASVTIPYRSGQAALSWVAEGAAIPVKSYALGEAKVGPLQKLAGITVHSRELARTASVAAIFERLLREDAAYSLDAAVFSNAAATTAAPAGLLNGVTALTASTNMEGRPAYEGDMIALSAAITAAGAQSVIFVTTPLLAATIQIVRPELAGMVWAAPGLPAGRVIAIDPAAFAFASGLVDIDASKSAAIHMDTAPTAISTAGTPNTVAAPVRNMLQHDLVATRIIMDISFAMRASGLVAWIAGASW